MPSPRAPRVILSGLLTFITLGCSKPAEIGVLELTLPEDQGKRTELVLRSGFAEYVELPDLRNELRIMLASDETFCDPYRPPGPSDTRVTLTISTPPDVRPGRGQFPWRGLAAAAEPAPTLDSPPGAVTGLAPAVDEPAPAPSSEPPVPTGVSVRAEAMPVIRRGGQAYLFEPGGGLELREVDLSPNGRIVGLLGFEFPGDQKRSRTSLSGKFSARVCRSTVVDGDR